MYLSRIIVMAGLVLLINTPASARTRDATHPALANTSDYTFMWWAYGLRDPRKVFNIQTSRYGLSFDFDNFALTHFGPINNPPAEAEALVENNDRLSSLLNVALEISVESGGRSYRAVKSGTDYRDCKLIESGKWFQRRWLDKLQFENGAPSLTGRLEIAAWPDRVSFILRLKTSQAIPSATPKLILRWPEGSRLRMGGAGANAFFTDASGKNGYACFVDGASVSLIADKSGNYCKSESILTDWSPGEERVIALIVYPISGRGNSRFNELVEQDLHPAIVSADQILPVSATLEVSYDKTHGWHRVTLRNDVVDRSPEALNDRMEEVALTIQNPYNSSRIVRFNFAKEDHVLGITGISAVLCDEEGNPRGVPVQISKNWHGWVWYHGLAMITVPARTTLRLRYRSVNGHWGGVAAASHAQLCLVGWGTHQQWDQAAIGSWGESICFDPDVNLMRSMIDDVRPLMVHGMKQDEPTRWTWTNNVGGGDFLVYVDHDGGRQWNSRMRTQFRRYCPNLTETTYAGQSHDGKILVKCTVSLYRTDDIVRGIYHFRYDVREPVEFQRLALFQMGSDHYNDHTFGKIAFGNEDGLLEEWEPEHGGWRYSRKGIVCPGRVPWWSLHEAVSRDESKSGAWANRGLIVRSWSARIEGKAIQSPYAAIYGTEDGGFRSALVELSLPPETKQLQPGDYVEAEVVQAVMPQYSKDYYGPNKQLASALAKNENTWRMIHREAIGNNLMVTAARGRVEKTYPVRIHVDRKGGAEFTVKGGLGYVPITFVGVPAWKDWILEEKSGSEWKQIDQSVHGRDFWQTDFDPVSKSWEITYTKPMDTPEDQAVTRSFRFRVKS